MLRVFSAKHNLYVLFWITWNLWCQECTNNYSHTPKTTELTPQHVFQSQVTFLIGRQKLNINKRIDPYSRQSFILAEAKYLHIMSIDYFNKQYDS